MYPRRRFTLPLPGGRTLELGARTLVMGIINVTPDSFSDGGVFLDSAHAVDAGMQMVADGADLLDVGGESTRPGAHALDAAEERRRVLPVIERLASKVNVPISVDTYKASIADAALEAGASMVNDISGLRYEPDLAQVVARARRSDHPDAHARAFAATCTSRPSTTRSSTRCSTSCARASPLPPAPASRRSRCWSIPVSASPRSPSHSFEVLARLDEFSDLGRPLVVGPSRKGLPDATASPGRCPRPSATGRPPPR